MIVVDNMSSTLTSRKDISFILLFDRFLSFNKQLTGSCYLIYSSNILCPSSLIVDNSIVQQRNVALPQEVLPSNDILKVII